MNEQPRKVPRFLSCLVKGPFGCLAFVLGALAILVLLLPPALGRIVDRSLESWFRKHHEGELELADAWVGSLWGAQRIDSLILRDPSGDEVIRASLSGPPLGSVLDGPLHRYGPLTMRIEAMRLVMAADGTSNLERALRERVEKRSRGSWKTDIPFEVELELVIERLRYTTASGSRTPGREALLEDLTFKGILEWGPQTTRLILDGGSRPGSDEPMQVRIELVRSVFDTSWTVRLALRGVPTILARTLCPALRPLSALLGPRIDHIAWSHDGREVELELQDDGARLDLMGQADDDVVRDSNGGLLRVGLPCGPRASALLAFLLPVYSPLECIDPASYHALRLVDFSWPLAGNLAAIEGILELTPAASRCSLVPGVRTWLSEPEGMLALEEVPIAMGVHGGAVEFEGLTLPRGVGRLQLDGSLSLEEGLTEITLRTNTAGGELEAHLIGQPGDLVSVE